MRYLILMGLFLAGCKPANDFSRSKYLTPKDYKCYEPTNARLNEVQSMLPQGFVSASFGSLTPTVINRLAGIPNDYLQHLIDRFKSRKFVGFAPENLGGGVAGLTRLEGRNEDEMYAKSIALRMDSVGFALQHEVGHALETFVKLEARKRKINFNSGFQAIFSEVQKSPGIRAYARSSVNESWAEAFANFYCSPESKEFIDGGSKSRGLPQTSSFLAQVLIQPQWLATTPNGPTSSSSDLFVALTADSNVSDESAQLHVSTLTSVDSVEFCVPGSETLCTASSKYYQRLDTSTDRLERRFFSAKNPIKLQNELVLLMVGRSASGDILTSRRIKLKSN